MLATLTKKRTSAIAFDFGACSLRAAQLVRRGDVWHPHHWVNIEVEPASAEPPEMDYERELELAFGPGTFTGARAALVLSPPHVEYQLLEVPPVILNKPPAELRNALQFELERQLPWPVAESEVAAWPIRPGADGPTHAVVVAARTESVRGWLDALSTQRLDCCRADVVPHAIIRACGARHRAQGPEQGGQMWAALDVGFQSSRLYLIHEDRPIYARVLRGGGREITETLATALHVDFRIAEQYKRIHGLERTDRGVRSIAGGLTRIRQDELPRVLYAVLRPTIEAMAREIERAWRFALGQFPGASAGQTYLIGGGARLKGLGDALSAELGIAVTAPDPAAALPSVRSERGTGIVAVDHGLEGRATSGHPLAKPDNYTVMAPCVGLAMMEDRA